MDKIIGTIVVALFIAAFFYAFSNGMKKTQDGWIRYDIKHGMVDVNGHPMSLLKKK